MFGPKAGRPTFLRKEGTEDKYKEPGIVLPEFKEPHLTLPLIRFAATKSVDSTSKLLVTLPITIFGLAPFSFPIPLDA